MAEPLALTSPLLSGGATLGIEAVKEGTKDAHRGSQDVVGEAFGPKATKAFVKVAGGSTVEAGRQELERYGGRPHPQDPGCPRDGGSRDDGGGLHP